MSEIVITKGDLRIEINLKELLAYLDSEDTKVSVEEVKVTPAVVPAEATVEDVPERSKRPYRRKTAVEEPVEEAPVAVEPEPEPEPEPVEEAPIAVEPEPEPVEEVSAEPIPATIDELKRWFLNNKLDLDKLKDVVLPKWGIRSIGAVDVDKIPEFYADLVAIRK